MPNYNCNFTLKKGKLYSDDEDNEEEEKDEPEWMK